MWSASRCAFDVSLGGWIYGDKSVGDEKKLSHLLHVADTKTMSLLFRSGYEFRGKEFARCILGVVYKYKFTL